MSKREQKVKEMSHSVSLQVNRKLHFFSRVNEGRQLLPPMIKKKEYFVFNPLPHRDDIISLQPLLEMSQSEWHRVKKNKQKKHCPA